MRIVTRQVTGSDRASIFFISHLIKNKRRLWPLARKMNSFRAFAAQAYPLEGLRCCRGK